MSFLAERHSPFFKRTLEAWQRRQSAGFDLTERLRGSVLQPLDAATIDGWLAELTGVAPNTDGGRAGDSTAGSPVAGSPAAGSPVATIGDAAAVMRGLRRTRLLVLMTLIERDVGGHATLDEVCTAMTILAQSATRYALRAAGHELAQRHGVPLDGDGQPQDLLAIGMGKAGGFELNVSSDLDLVFVFREEGETRGRLDEQDQPVASSRIASSEFMHKLARRAVYLLAENTEDGFVFRVDTRLRPNGDSCPLVVSLSMLENYFYSQGREWERLAWLKGRVIADSGLSGAAARDEADLEAIVTPFVFRRYLDFKAFAALRELHAMIARQVNLRDARHEGSYDVKLGRGGIREIEFTAQLFQIVRGGRDYALRDKRTLPTLRTLGERHLLTDDEVATLTEAYALLRRTEHALQYLEDAQTHRLPAEADKRAEIAAMLGLEPAEFEARLARLTTTVERVFDALLHGPEAADGPADPVPAGGAPGPDRGAEVAQAALVATNAPLTGHPDAVRERIDELRAGSRYRAARPETREGIDQLLDTHEVRMAGELGVLRLIDLLEAVSGRGGYVALLRQYPQARERVLRMLGRAKWAADYLTRHPILLDELLDGQLLQPVDYAQWSHQVRQSLDAAVFQGVPDQERQMDIVREAHHAQVFRLLAQDLEGRLQLERLSDLLSELADRVIEIVIPLVWSQLRLKFRDAPRFAAIAYGKLGGKELGYASDLDLVFLYEDDDERAPEAYAMLGQRVAGWMATRTAAGQLFDIDLRLRPNGDAGLLVSNLKSFTAYQEESAWVWEHQALTRARYAAGDAGLGERFETVRRRLLAQPRDIPALAAEVVKMRKKMLDGHPNRSRQFDLKHDRGGMVDIEFIVQFLVLAYAHRLPQLLDNKGNIALLQRSADAGLISARQATGAADAYRKYRQLQHLMRLNDHEYARLDGQAVAAERQAVLDLWNHLFPMA